MNTVNDWVRILNEGGPSACMLQQQLRLGLSPFGRMLTVEAKRSSIASNAGEVKLMGPRRELSDTELANGSAELDVRNGEALVLEELNYRYAEAAGGSLTDNLRNFRLILKNQTSVIDGRDFRLSAWMLGDASLRFGSIPLRLWLPGGVVPVLSLMAPNAGTDNLLIEVSLTARAEPLDLARAAGLVA